MPLSTDLNLIDVFVAHKNLVYISTEEMIEDEENEENDLSVVLRYSRQGDGSAQWSFQTFPVLPVTAMDVNAQEAVFVGVEGDYLIERAGAQAGGLIDASADGPAGRGWIRAIRRCGNKVFAVGMSRQAYRLEDNDEWSRIDKNLLAAWGEVKGLNALDGFSETEVYAGGYDGEIWRYDGQDWRLIPSPARGPIFAVRRFGEHIYTVGSGHVLRGRHDQFEIVCKSDGLSNLHALEAFQGRLFMASARGIYRLEGGQIKAVHEDDDCTYGQLSAADGVIWSVGFHHILRSADGENWEQIFIETD